MSIIITIIFLLSFNDFSTSSQNTDITIKSTSQDTSQIITETIPALDKSIIFPSDFTDSAIIRIHNKNNVEKIQLPSGKIIMIKIHREHLDDNDENEEDEKDNDKEGDD